MHYPSHYRDGFIDVGDVRESGHAHRGFEFASHMKRAERMPKARTVVLR